MALAAVAGALLLLGGVLLLRRSWLGRRPRNLPYLLGGWVLIAGGIALFAAGSGAEVGTAYALLCLSLTAFAVLAFGMEDRSHRPEKVREPALEPEQRVTNWRRASVKALLSIPLAGVAAIGVGVAFAVAMPIPVHDRIVIGGLLVPILWGGGMAWTLSDSKLLRAAIVLGAISALGYAIAFLPKVLT